MAKTYRIRRKDDGFRHDLPLDHARRLLEERPEEYEAVDTVPPRPETKKAAEKPLGGDVKGDSDVSETD